MMGHVLPCGALFLRCESRRSLPSAWSLGLF